MSLRNEGVVEVKRTGPTNIVLRKMVRLLRKYAKENDAPIWRTIAEALEKPTRKRITVNVSKINRHTNEGDVVVIPGKVLGAGRMDHAVTVAALSFSEQAIRKIKEAGGRVLNILELVEENKKGSNIKIIA